MDTTTLIIIGAAAIVALVFVFVLRRLSWGSSPGFIELTPRATPAVRLDPAAENQLREMIASGQKIEAIKRVREQTGLGLKEAKDYVEQLPRGAIVATPSYAESTSHMAPAVQLNPTTEDELRDLVARGQKIEAIKRVREQTGLGLKEAKDYVEQLSRGTQLIAATPAMDTPVDQQAVEQAARALLASGDIIAAVKRVRELTGWGLKESREFVQSLSPTQPGTARVPMAATPRLGDPAVDPEVQIQLAKGNKIQAIKRVRELTGWGLKEAKDFVDGLEASH
jgi:ribosomal protein L7/L12